jgi:hypothetical protein
MANLVGPTFYAGWQDFYAVRKAADRHTRAVLLAQLLGLPAGSALVQAAASKLTARELKWFEQRMLIMQRIFQDLAWQHEAYVQGGIAEGDLNPRPLARYGFGSSNEGGGHEVEGRRRDAVPVSTCVSPIRIAAGVRRFRKGLLQAAHVLVERVLTTAPQAKAGAAQRFGGREDTVARRHGGGEDGPKKPWVGFG